MVTAIINPKFGLQKEGIIQMMREKGIDTRPFFYPLSSQPAYADLAQTEIAKMNNNVAYRISPYGVNLPCGLNMNKEKVDFVCDELIKVLEGE